MISKNVALCILLCLSVALSETGISLVYVFDTTGSMSNDLTVAIETGKGILAATQENKNDVPVKNYILAPFNDPGVGPVTKTTDPTKFRAALERIKLHNGGDCPEMCLTGIEQGMNAAEQKSLIFVFTDAGAKDYGKVNDILRLIQKKQCKVTFLLTGVCSESDVKYYQQIAQASSGMVFRPSKTGLKRILGWVKENIKDRRTSNLVSIGNQKPGPSSRNVTVDPNMKEIIISVGGKDPKIKVTGPDGKTPDKVTTEVETGNNKVVTVEKPKPGVTKIETGSSSNHTIRVEATLNGKEKPIEMEVHLKRKQPGANTWKRTTDPKQGEKLQLVVDVINLVGTGRLTNMQLISLGGKVLKNLDPGAPLKTTTNITNNRYTNEIRMPEKGFNVKVIGVDKSGNNFERLSSVPIIVVTDGNGPPPIVTMAKKKMVLQYGEAGIVIQCNVKSDTKFDVWIEKNGARLGSQSFPRSTVYQFSMVKTIDIDSEGTYTCYAKNKGGVAFDETEVQVKGKEKLYVPSNTLAVLVGFYFRTNGRSDQWAKSFSKNDIDKKLGDAFSQTCKIERSRITVDRIKTKKYSEMAQVVIEVREPDSVAKYLTDDMYSKVNKFAVDAYQREAKMNFGISAILKPVHANLTATLKIAKNIGDTCKRSEFCPMQYSECAADPLLVGNRRCACLKGYLGVTEKTCKKLADKTNADCEPCVTSEGKCYENGTNTGCKCPMWRGKNALETNQCSKEYVKVHCNSEDVTLCVTPFDSSIDKEFDGFEKDLRTGRGASIHVKENEAACSFQRVTSKGGLCKVGDYEANLRLDDDMERLKCGTAKYKDNPKKSWTSYQNSLIVRTSRHYTGQINFRCEYDGTGSANNGHLLLPKIDKKEDKDLKRIRKATIQLSILDREMNQLTSGSTVAYGDEIKIFVEMTKNSVVCLNFVEAFQAIRVINCDASSDSNFIDTLRIFQDGCPAGGQTFLTKESTFHPVAGDMERMLTFPKGMKMFRVRPNKNKFYLKCNVKVCQFERDCQPVKCGTGPTAYDSYGRRKRAAGEQVDIPLEFLVDIGDSRPAVEHKGWIGAVVGGIAGMVGLLLITTGAVFAVKQLAKKRARTAPNFLEKPDHTYVNRTNLRHS